MRVVVLSPGFYCVTAMHVGTNSSMFQVSLRGQPTRPQGNVGRNSPFVRLPKIRVPCSSALVGNGEKNVPGWRL